MAHTEERLIHGEMTPVSVFDSSAQEIDDAVNKANNAVSKSGDTMTGHLEHLDANSGRTARTAYSSTGYATLINRLDSANYNGVRIFPETEALARSLVFAHSIVSVISKEYAIFGEHNKPSGSYTGNGDATERTIQIGGIGNALLIRRESNTAIITSAGRINFVYATGSVKMGNEAKFENGVLTITTEDGGVNANGGVYYYQVL